MELGPANGPSPNISLQRRISKIKYRVVMCSGGGTKVTFASDMTHSEASQLAEDCGWEYTDENGFVWNLEVEEDR